MNSLLFYMSSSAVALAGLAGMESAAARSDEASQRDLCSAGIAAQSPQPETPTPKQSIEVTPDLSSQSESTEIIVSAVPERETVIGKISPERTFTPFEIDTFDATDIGTLIQNLGPTAGSVRGGQESGPIVLLNGRRISGLAEIARIPTEAIERMEIFPEELALSYGFRPDQKVVNIVLFEIFRRSNGSIDLSSPTEAGITDNQVLLDFLQIRKDLRFNIDASYRNSSQLLENERNLLPIEETLEGASEFRTLRPKTERFGFNGAIAKTLPNGISATITSGLSEEINSFLIGLQFESPIVREIQTTAVRAGVTVNGQWKEWNWSIVTNFDEIDTAIFTQSFDSINPRDNVNSSNKSGNAEFVVSGPLFNVPAGPVAISLRARLGRTSFSGTSIDDEEQIEIARENISFQSSLDVPITSLRSGPEWLGTLSANANVAIDRLSDVGTLRTYEIGLRWSPFEAFRFYSSLSAQDRAPSIDQLGASQLVTPVARVFDFIRGDTVEITQISGGNGNLTPELRKQFSLGFDAKPLRELDLTLTANFIDVDIKSPINAFSIGNGAIETAAPERFVRDDVGQLQRLDIRPLNFERAHQQTLRTGVTFARRLTSGPPVPKGTSYSNLQIFPNEAAMRAALPPGTVVVEALPGSDRARQLDSLTSRVTISLFHTWLITDEVVAQAGGPTFNRLAGFSTDLRDLRPRHELSLQAGLFQDWFGARLTANWRDSRALAPAVVGEGSSLKLDALTTVNFSLFVKPAERFGGKNAPKWIKGTRIGFSVENVFNIRPSVKNEDGITPFIFQPVFFDPLGRTLSLEIRKSF